MARTATRTNDRKADARETAIAQADPSVREIYDRQRARAEEGWPEFDPMTMSRVVFRPNGRDGSYQIEVAEVTDDRERARKEGLDYWHPQRGWILRGVKAAADIGTQLPRPPARASRPVAAEVEA